MNPYESKTYKNDGLWELLQDIPQTARRILDVGCGAGDNAKILKNVSRELHGVTLSDTEAKLAAPHFHKVTVANVENWKTEYPEGYFDAIVLSHVLEHLVNPLATLKQLGKLLRNGGSLYVATPNVLFWKQRAQFLMGKFDYTDEGILDRTHLRFFTPKSFCRLIEEAGFEVLQTRAVGHFPWGPLRKLAPKFTAAIDQALCRQFPGVFGFHLICNARKN